MIFTQRNFTRLMFMMMAKVWGVNGGGGVTAPISVFNSAYVPPMYHMPLKKSSTNLHLQALNSGKSVSATQLNKSLSFDNPKFAMKHNNKNLYASVLDLGEMIEEENKVAIQEKDILLNGAKTTLPITLRRLLLQPNQLKAFEISKEPLKSFYHKGMIIRHAIPEDAIQIRQLEISLINSENVKSEIEIEQIERDLKEGFANALVIEIKEGENKLIIGYLSYTIASSLNGGKVVYLGDLINDIKYKDLPIKMYGEIAKLSAKNKEIKEIQAIAHSKSTGYFLFPGMDIVPKETFWQLQLNNKELEKILKNGINVLCGTLKSTIYLPGKLSGADAIYLVKQWEEMNINEKGELLDKSIDLNILTNLLKTGQLGAVTVHLDARQSLISILFFHGNYYSLWDGQSIWIDKMSVSPMHFECHFPNAISAMFAKLVELSNAIGAKRIGWTFNEESTKNFGEIMENIGAINMSKKEDWHIYRSNKSEFSEYLTTTGDNYMKLNETHKKRANDLLKKEREIEKI